MIFEGILPYTEIAVKNISLLDYIGVFLGGMLVSITPCVYPLIPITVGYIGATSVASRSRGFLLSLFYVFGIAVTYAGLGAFAALTGKLFGEISTSPWTYLIVGNIFLILGLSMMGLFILPLPSFLATKSTTTKKPGIFGAFLVGLSAGFIVGPCTAPVLGAVLTYVASKQNVFIGISLLFVFAFGMGILLIIVGTFTGLCATLPKSGKWLDAVKKIFGIILIICAEYFIILAGKRF
jgi:thiol:disulfide interchange protein DsbD